MTTNDARSANDGAKRQMTPKANDSAANDLYDHLYLSFNISDKKYYYL